MQWWMRPGTEPLLGDQEAGAARRRAARRPARARRRRRSRRARRSAPNALVRVLHRRHVAQDLHARRVDRHDEHRRALVAVRVGVGDRHDDQEVGDRRVGGEPLAAVDDPVVAVLDGARLQQRRVAARGVGLGHRERRAQVAGQQRVQPLLLLVLRAGQREDLGVARVRRLVAERDRRERLRAEDLVHQAELDLAEALAAEVGRQVRRPQAALADLLLQRRDRALEAVLAELVEDRLERPDLLAHEVAHPVELLLELGLGGEVPGHARPDHARVAPATPGSATRAFEACDDGTDAGGAPRERRRRPASEVAAATAVVRGDARTAPAPDGCGHARTAASRPCTARRAAMHRMARVMPRQTAPRLAAHRDDVAGSDAADRRRGDRGRGGAAVRHRLRFLARRRAAGCSRRRVGPRRRPRRAARATRSAPRSTC